jgi:aminoglycoside 2''-phosphotransferase
MLVFRFPRSADGVQRLQVELTALDTIKGGVSLPVPDPAFVGKDTQTPGKAFLGYQKVPGEPLSDHVDALRAGPAFEQVAAQLATFVRELHAVPTNAVQGLPIHDEVRREQLPVLHEQIREDLYPRMRPDARDQVTGEFERFSSDRQSLTYARAIKHGDLTPGNVLVDPQDLRVSGIIDFGSAGLDDPAVDLGVVAFWGAATFGDGFVERFLDTYAIAEPLLGRVRFYRVMIALSVGLEGLLGEDRETFDFAMASYV